MSTKEQIEEAKIDIKNVVRLSLGVVPLDDALALLDALEVAEQNLAEYKRKAIRDACPECTAMKAMQERAEAAQKERDKWKTLAEETEIERERIAARADEAESHIKELEAAGNKMRSSCILREACDEWDALMDASITEVADKALCERDTQRSAQRENVVDKRLHATK